MPEPFLSLVIPAYQEERRIGATLESVVAYLKLRPYPWEVVVVDDGSTDGTGALVKQMAAKEPRVRLEQVPHRGKGAALRQGMQEARGQYLFLCDADLSMPITQVARFLPPALSDYDLAIGSREVPGARRLGEPRWRRLQGRVFNRLTRWLVVPGLADTQCGFKSLHAGAARQLLPLLRIDGFSFDVELLFLARRERLRIVEVPIDWHYQGHSRVRPLQDALRMLGEVLAIRWNSLRGGYSRRAVPSGPPQPSAEPVPPQPSSSGHP